jgi:hypothetical protein
MPMSKLSLQNRRAGGWRVPAVPAFHAEEQTSRTGAPNCFFWSTPNDVKWVSSCALIT